MTPAPIPSRSQAIFYRTDQPNHCPGCGGQHWLVGRINAECAACATAIPLVSPAPSGLPLEGSR